MTISMTLCPPQHILYIDDDPDYAILVARVLEHLGHTVVTFDEPGEALEAIRRDPRGWDAVITDYNMPGTNGIAVARTVSRQFPHLPCAVVSSFVTGAMNTEAASAGLAAPLSKPASMREFDQLVLRMTAPRRAGGCVNGPKARLAQDLPAQIRTDFRPRLAE